MYDHKFPEKKLHLASINAFGVLIKDGKRLNAKYKNYLSEKLINSYIFKKLLRFHLHLHRFP